MAKLRDSGVDYVYEKGAARGTLAIRVDGELVYQKKPGRDPENPQPFSKSNYWIIGLGPINADGFYDWATVSDEGLQSLYVLARDVATFKAEYEDEVLSTLAAQGFTSFLNKPIETNQDGCTY